MAKSKTGGCQCGYVKYRLGKEPTGLTVCHCKDCQRQSSSAFGMSLAVSPDAFQLISGSLKTFEMICDSGRVKTCAFCPQCGTRIYHQTGDGMSVKAGTLDNTSDLKPDAHYWTARKQSWVVIPPDFRQFSDDG